MRPTLIAALLGVVILVLPGAHAQQAEALRRQFAELKARADKGDAHAQAAVGDAYTNGEGVAKSHAEAAKWYRLAADQNVAEAQFNLGNCYLEGHGVPKNQAEAVKWYRRAADQNLGEAQLNLGSCYFVGKGTKQDYAEGVKWFRKAAEQNISEAQNNLGAAYLEGQGVPKDQVEAYAWFNLAAMTDKDAAKARDALAKKLSPQDLAKARTRTQELMQSAASDRERTERNARDEAERRARLAAMAKNPGLFVAPAQKNAALRQELRPMAEQGAAKAQWQLGNAYSFAAPVEAKDDREAIRWFRKAAEQNYGPAQESLAWFYERGSGVERSEAEAMKWRRKAAEQNSTGAQWSLGFCYRDGKGVEKDPVEAYAWFDLAARSVRDAPRNRDELGSKMSPEQVAAGKKRAEELRAQIAARLKSDGK